MNSEVSFKLNGKSALYKKEKKQLPTFLPSVKKCTQHTLNDIHSLNSYIFP